MIVLLVGLLPGQFVSAEGPDQATCPMGFDEPGHHRVTAAGNQAIVIDFDVVGAYEGRFYYGLAFAMEESMPPELPTREGAIASRVIEDRDGNVLDYAATRVYREGFALDVAGQDVTVAEGPGSQCGWLASGGDVTLALGAYRMVVPGASDHGSEIGALLPEAVRIQDVRVVPVLRVDADALSCGHSTTGVTPWLRPTVLLDCRLDVDVAAGARAYWTLQSEARPDDPLREATWRTAAGDAYPVTRCVVGSGAAGDYALEVPKWIAPAGHLMLGPPESVLPPDAGVAGVVAVVG